MIYCEFHETGEQVGKKRLVVCAGCGRRVVSGSQLDRIHARCKLNPPDPPKKPGIGDYLHYWLTRWGIYYGPITWLRRQFAKEHENTCTPCAERQQAMNKAGWWATEALASFYRRFFRPRA